MHSFSNYILQDSPAKYNHNFILCGCGIYIQANFIFKFFA
ncbi:hypothetical protein BRYFOR_08140 [Marvinbryantia formatexigens DSM 14469]|uniref:Uncharacterized protein n=1 Tax=Marvinbryantia formatexigens DSM 14469 TaxID=478749 RepID=C6LHM8_9FIRM|nr:hypothetical protein BRYFOR_08140 [Marvinbryantia formatexigens DSM 14469]